jgi:hypothetical protein
MDFANTKINNNLIDNIYVPSRNKKHQTSLTLRPSKASRTTLGNR